LIVALVIGGISYTSFDYRKRNKPPAAISFGEELEQLAEVAERERVRHEGDAEYHKAQVRYWKKRTKRLLAEAAEQTEREANAGLVHVRPRVQHVVVTSVGGGGGGGMAPVFGETGEAKS
jgi:hypothetical protein